MSSESSQIEGVTKIRRLYVTRIRTLNVTTHSAFQIFSINGWTGAISKSGVWQYLRRAVKVENLRFENEDENDSVISSYLALNSRSALL